jgi:hypothetical protein
MKKFMLLLALLWAAAVHAEDQLLEESDRDLASVPPANSASTNHRTFPGGADEDDLQVQSHLPEAALRTDPRQLQKEVYKTLYKQDLKDDGRESVEE